MNFCKKMLSLALCAGLLLSLSVWVSAAGLTLKVNRDISATIGAVDVPLIDENTVSVFNFVSGEAGVFRVTVSGENCTLYTVSGSLYYMFNPQVVPDNSMELEVKESYTGTPFLFGIAGTGTATFTVSRVGEAAFDVNALPYETYQPTATLTKFTKPKTVELVEYVDITTPHTAVKAADGSYHLDTPDGPILYIDLIANPYLSIAAVASNGGMKDIYYDENGNFIKKEEYITCINKYYGYTDNSTNRPVAGYTDGGVYPLTDDMVYIMQNHTANYGWNDSTSPNYLFADEKVDADTAWMFPMCYFMYTGDVNGDLTVDAADAVHLLYYTLLPDQYPLMLKGDINGDDSINAADAIYLLYHALLPDLYPVG